MLAQWEKFDVLNKGCWHNSSAILKRIFKTTGDKNTTSGPNDSVYVAKGNE